MSSYRGYIGSRPYNRELPPQHIQNLVVRDYCERRGATYLLSVTEYGMPGCFLMLEDALEQLAVEHGPDGIVMYSIWMLPDDRERRRDVCRRALAAGATLHGAVEKIIVEDERDIARLDDLWAITRLAERSIEPLRGRRR